MDSDTGGQRVWDGCSNDNTGVLCAFCSAVSGVTFQQDEVNKCGECPTKGLIVSRIVVSLLAILLLVGCLVFIYRRMCRGSGDADNDDAGVGADSSAAVKAEMQSAISGYATIYLQFTQLLGPSRSDPITQTRLHNPTRCWTRAWRRFPPRLDDAHAQVFSSTPKLAEAASRLR